ncbi:MAG: hypothetical protein ACM3L9_07630 [Deltaproteobacteria bacterium]
MSILMSWPGTLPSGTFHMLHFRSSRLLPVLAATAILAGCSASAPSLPSMSAMPDVSAITPKLTPADAPRPVGAPTEIYTRVARGILTCWFGPNGPLKPGYIYFADADPPSKGGGAVISIHKRDREASDPRSIRAWKLAVVPAPEGTTVDIENFKLPPEYAEPLGRDARRWAAGEEGCGEGPVTAGWDANAAAPAAKSSASAKKSAVNPAGQVQR